MTAPIRHEVADETAWHTLRSKAVGSSESAALLGVSPYLTRYQLWHAKRDPEFGRAMERSRAESDRVDWGKRLEPVVAQAVAEQERLALRAGHRLLWQSGAVERMTATLDYFVEEGEAGPGVVEVKCIDWLRWRETWTETEAAPHVEVQLQHQLAVTGWSWGLIAALVGGNELRIYRREPHAKVIQRLETEIATFWETIEQDRQPAVEDERDLGAVLRLIRATRPEPVVLGDDIDQAIADWRTAHDLATSNQKRADFHKAQVFAALGDHELGRSAHFTVRAPITTVNRKATEATTYTQRRLTVKEETNDVLDPSHDPSAVLGA